MTDAHCHFTANDPTIGELIVGRDFYGIHPWETLAVSGPGDLDIRLEELRARLMADPRAGVGEIGLDRLKVRELPPLMYEVFAKQLALALEFGRPVVLHGARCWGQVVARVRAEFADIGGKGVPLLFHGFSRSDGLIPEIIALGGYISVGPAILNDHAVNYREMVKRIPLDRLLVETDRDDPADTVSVRDIVAKLAGILGRPGSEIEAVTDRNAACFRGVI